MPLHWEPIGHKIRILPPGATFENKDEYQGGMVVLYTHEMDKAYISHAHAEANAITTLVWDEVMDGCKAQGVKEASYKHKGKTVTNDLVIGKVHCQPVSGKCNQDCEYCKRD